MNWGWLLTINIPTLLAEYFIVCTFYNDFLGYKRRSKMLLVVGLIFFIVSFTSVNEFIKNNRVNVYNFSQSG